MSTERLPSLFPSDPFDRALRSLMRPMGWEGAAEPPQIRLDVTETDAAYAVKAEIPGVRREDIHVAVEGRQVSISAETQREHDEKQDGRVLRRERSRGWMSRAFLLDNEVDAARVAATYKDGVLALTLPKKASTRSTRIVIE